MCQKRSQYFILGYISICDGKKVSGSNGLSQIPMIIPGFSLNFSEQNEYTMPQNESNP